MVGMKDPYASPPVAAVDNHRAPPLVDHGDNPRNRPPADHVYVPPTEREEAEWEARHAAFQTAWVRAHPEELDDDPDDLSESLELM